MSHAERTTETLDAIDRLLPKFSGMIGKTPMLEIELLFDEQPFTIYAKYEQKNMTGSVKDRMAAWILGEALATGALDPGDTIVEATSGNTGISLAAIGRAMGHGVRIYMPDWMSRERVDLIKSFGAEICPVSKDDGGFLGSIAKAETWANEHDHVFLPRQFQNEANVRAHEMTTGPEIAAQCAMIGRTPDAVVAGVGTGGTIMGLSRALKARFPKITAHPLEPANSPTLRTGCKVGKHRVQGISDEFVPNIVQLHLLDDIIDVWDGDAILMAQSLCKNLGLAVGISSGANLLGALQLALRYGPAATIVTVFADSNKKYLSTDLCRDEPVLPHYLSRQIRLLRFRAIPCPG